MGRIDLRGGGEDGVLVVGVDRWLGGKSGPVHEEQELTGSVAEVGAEDCEMQTRGNLLGGDQAVVVESRAEKRHGQIEADESREGLVPADGDAVHPLVDTQLPGAQVVERDQLLRLSRELVHELELLLVFDCEEQGYGEEEGSGKRNDDQHGWNLRWLVKRATDEHNIDFALGQGFRSTN